MIAYAETMTPAEKHEALSSELLSVACKLVDIAATFAVIGLPSYADVATEMADTCLTQSCHLKQLAAKCEEVTK